MPWRKLGGVVALLCCALHAPAQDVSTSLGDVARRERARKSRNVRPARRVYTNENISVDKPETASPQSTQPSHANAGKSPAPKRETRSASTRELQTKIRAQKQKVHGLEARMREIQRRLDQRDTMGNVTVVSRATLQDTMISPGLCATASAAHNNPYKDWCEEPVKLRAELDQKKSELKQARAELEDLQEQARRMGYGNAFYDPD